MENNNAILGIIFGAGIGIIFNSTGLGLSIAATGLILGLVINKLERRKK